MARDIDLTRGGYTGDDVEERFKWFTSQHMEYWWHFREVFRSTTSKVNTQWQKLGGGTLTDDEYKQLLALSMINYGVYTGISEAYSFFEELKTSISQNDIFTLRRSWKGLYSSLYSSFNALCNVVCVVCFHKSPFGDNPNKVWNWTPSDAIREARNDIVILEPLKRCIERLEIRSQLDHYWTIWTGMRGNKFLIDSNFKKGYIVLDPQKDIDWDRGIDGTQLAIDHLAGCAEDFNLIYKRMATTAGDLDSYLQTHGWAVNYLDYGFPHNCQRPKP